MGAFQCDFSPYTSTLPYQIIDLLTSYISFGIEHVSAKIVTTSYISFGIEHVSAKIVTKFKIEMLSLHRIFHIL